MPEGLYADEHVVFQLDARGILAVNLANNAASATPLEMNSLIRADNTWALWAVIIVRHGLAIWLEQSYRWAAKISGPVLALVIAMVLSNMGIMPTRGAVLRFRGRLSGTAGDPLLLLRANLFRIARETGWMFVAFHISALGTMVGAAIVATLLLRRSQSTTSRRWRGS